METEREVARHYHVDNLLERIDRGLTAEGKESQSLIVDDLAPIDAFHTRGREATRELSEIGGVHANHRVLDVGCGLGGTARFLANAYGCHVDGVDLSDEFVSVGTTLNERVGLTQKVTLHCASALTLPFEPQAYDIVWTEHAQMNIADKKAFYKQISLVLKTNGLFLFHDVFLANGESPIYPTPWAEVEALSAIASWPSVKNAMQESGLEPIRVDDKTDESIRFFDELAKNKRATAASGKASQLGIQLLMGSRAQEKVRNYAQNLREKRVQVIMGVARRVGGQ